MTTPDHTRNQQNHELSPSEHSTLPALDRSDKKNALKNRFITEMANYILTNNGPDEHGYPCSEHKRVNARFLREALNEAQKQGLSSEWQPYHFRGHIGTYTMPEYVDKLIVAKVDTVLNGGKFRGDSFRLFTEATAEDLFSDLEQTISKRNVRVSLCYVAKKFHDSPFIFLEHYRDIKGITDYDELKPYHMKKIPHGSFYDESLLNEVVTKKGAALLSQEMFAGNIFKLITKVTNEELKKPFTDTINGRKIEIGMDSVMHYLNDSPFEFSRQYCKALGLTKYADLKPYHMQTSTSRGTFDDSRVIDELIVKKLDSLLDAKFKGNIQRLITETTREDLLEPLIDKVGDKAIEVSMHRAINKYKDAIYPIICRYRDIKGIPGLEELQPYHMQSRTSRGSYQDQNMLNEVWIKKIDSLLSSAAYQGNLKKLKDEVTYEELASTFFDKIGPFSIEVSMSRPMALVNHDKDQIFKIYAGKIA